MIRLQNSRPKSAVGRRALIFTCKQICSRYPRPTRLKPRTGNSRYCKYTLAVCTCGGRSHHSHHGVFMQARQRESLGSEQIAELQMLDATAFFFVPRCPAPILLQIRWFRSPPCLLCVIACRVQCSVGCFYALLYDLPCSSLVFRYMDA